MESPSTVLQAYKNANKIDEAWCYLYQAKQVPELLYECAKLRIEPIWVGSAAEGAMTPRIYCNPQI